MLRNTSRVLSYTVCEGSMASYHYHEAVCAVPRFLREFLSQPPRGVRESPPAARPDSAVRDSRHVVGDPNAHNDGSSPTNVVHIFAGCQRRQQRIQTA